MAYDEHLADRIRELVGTEAGLSEQRMFGGLGFLLDGHMAVAVSSKGGIMVRTDPTDAAKLTAGGLAVPMEMGGRSMNGWLRVASDHLRTKRQLERWVRIGVTFARSLPPKTAKAPKRR